jgi:prepilin-type N-terminal cleavage/methylation domain-containing protein/prepilin-type processing-associated H-X9-DG protein
MKSRGFTLIELLVVIAIIAILAAILFPVFAQAREAARSSSCLSNTKQLSLGFMQYIQDYDERFPSWTWEFFCNGGNAGQARDSSAFWTMAIYPYVKNTGVYKCPDDLGELTDAWAGCSDDNGKNDLFNTQPNYVSYGFCEYLADTPKYAAIPAPAQQLLLSDSVDQLTSVGPLGWWGGGAASIVARVAFANDTDGNIFTENGSWNETWTATNFLSYFSQGQLDSATRHHGGANIAFADGHSKYFKWQNMTFCNLISNSSCPGTY